MNVMWTISTISVTMNTVKYSSDSWATKLSQSIVHTPRLSNFITQLPVSPVKLSVDKWHRISNVMFSKHLLCIYAPSPSSCRFKSCISQFVSGTGVSAQRNIICLNLKRNVSDLAFKVTVPHKPKTKGCLSPGITDNLTFQQHIDEMYTIRVFL